MTNIPADTPTKPPRHEARSLTRAEFCAAERISLSTFYKMKRAGNGPDEVRIPGLSIVRITPEAQREWRERMKSYRNSKAAILEEERRRALAAQAGRKAAASPLHVSKRRSSDTKPAPHAKAKR